MKKRVLSLLVLILFTSFFITGCFAKEQAEEVDDPWEAYKISKTDAKLNSLKRYYLVKPNKQHYLVLIISIRLLFNFWVDIWFTAMPRHLFTKMAILSDIIMTLAQSMLTESG